MVDSRWGGPTGGCRLRCEWEERVMIGWRVGGGEESRQAAMSAPRKLQVSLRGASAKEISREALLEKVSQERELRSYLRHSSAAALFIQRVWRRYYLIKKLSAYIQLEWESLVISQNENWSYKCISEKLLRPFLFFVNWDKKWRSSNIKNVMLCFQILLKNMQSTDPEKNFCSLALGISEERNLWLFQAVKVMSVCSLFLAECDTNWPSGDDRVLVTSLAVQTLIMLTDPKGWKVYSSEKHKVAETSVKRLIWLLANGEDTVYFSIRKYLMKWSSTESQLNSPTNSHFLIAAGAVTLALRPFQMLDSKSANTVALKDVAENYCTILLTIPSLYQHVPAFLAPSLRHKSVMIPCLDTLVISKEKVFFAMSKMDTSDVLEMGSLIIPAAAWALANIIDFMTETEGLDDFSGRFISGLDLKLYVHAVNSIAENLLGWLQNTGEAGKETCEQIESVDDFIYLLKPVSQQWHLMRLLTVVKDSVFFTAKDVHEYTDSGLELFNIVQFYTYMLQMLSTLNHAGGQLNILNMLSFTNGFLMELWETLEKLVMNREDVSDAFYERKGGNVMIESGNKWTAVLRKITGKPNDSNYAQCSVNDKQDVDHDCKAWDVEYFRLGPRGISKNISCLMYLFCATYSHLLLVLDDVEFYQKQVPFSLKKQRAIASMLNTLVFNGISHCSGQHKSLMDAATRCLHLLYERDCRHMFCPATLWTAPARNSRPPVAAAARAHEVAVSAISRSSVAFSNPQAKSAITTVPHVFPFHERVQMFREFIRLDKGSLGLTTAVAGRGPGVVEIVVRRDHVVEDGFRQLSSLGSRLKFSINVSFVSASGLPEAGLDYGGLSKEFLTDIARAAFDPRYGLFCQTSTEEGSLVPNTMARFLENGVQLMEFLGQIVGKALYEGILLDYTFAHVFVQKLLRRYSFLDELSTLDPEMYRNLIYVKHYEGDARDLSLDFTVTEDVNGRRVIIELKPGGKTVAVTNENKLHYVHAIADYKLNRQMLPLSNAFYRGLTNLISPTWLGLFNANEFNQLLSGGMHDIDVEDLRTNTQYSGGYSEKSRTIKLFWEVISTFEAKDRCLLLKFVTSCSRAPLLGFKHLQPPFTIHKVPCDVSLLAMIGGQDVDRLPSASTCYNTLKLPAYKRQSNMRSKLLYAINSNAGFELS